MVLSSTYKKCAESSTLADTSRQAIERNRLMQTGLNASPCKEAQRVPNRSRANRSFCGYPFGMISPLKLKKGDNSGTQANVPKQAGA